MERDKEWDYIQRDHYIEYAMKIFFFDPLGRPEPRLAAFSGTAPIVSRSGVFLFLERH